MWKLVQAAKHKKQLTDLHTHLLGMGDPVFWLDFVMKDVVRKLRDAEAVEVWPVEVSGATFPDGCLPTGYNFVRHAHAYHQCLNSLSPTLEQFEDEMHFSYDVVFSLSTFAQSLAIDLRPHKAWTSPACEDEELKMLVFAKLGNPGQATGPELRKLFMMYTVWNAREQNLEQRYGITCKELLKFANRPIGGQKFRDQLETFFEMKFPGETEASQAIKQLFFNGGFTPYFYPGRYKFKDDMYSQYPAVRTAIYFN